MYRVEDIPRSLWSPRDGLREYGDDAVAAVSDATGPLWRPLADWEPLHAVDSRTRATIRNAARSLWPPTEHRPEIGTRARTTLDERTASVQARIDDGFGRGDLQIPSVAGTRRSLLPRLDTRLKRLGGYAMLSVEEAGYVGTVDRPVEELETLLADQGFTYGLVAALKDRPCQTAPEIEAGSWVRRDSPLDAHQLHVHLFRSRDESRTDVYCHHEYNWKRHPLKHYQMDEIDRERGVELLRNLFDTQGISYEQLPRTTRCER